MAFNDTPVNAALTIDRSSPVGNSPGLDGRGRLHTKISNTASEPVFVTPIDSLLTSGTNIFSEALAVASGDTAIIATYTVAALKKFILLSSYGSGENFGFYTLEIDASIVDIQRTHFSNGLNADFKIGNDVGTGLVVNAGSTITLTVLNYRPETANYSGRIYGVLLDA